MFYLIFIKEQLARETLKGKSIAKQAIIGVLNIIKSERRSSGERKKRKRKNGTND